MTECPEVLEVAPEEETVTGLETEQDLVTMILREVAESKFSLFIRFNKHTHNPYFFIESSVIIYLN